MTRIVRLRFHACMLQILLPLAQAKQQLRAQEPEVVPPVPSPPQQDIAHLERQHATCDKAPVFESSKHARAKRIAQSTASSSNPTIAQTQPSVQRNAQGTANNSSTKVS